MNNTTTIALLTVSSLSLVVSSATLAIVLVGGKRAKTEVETIRAKANESVSKLKNALDNLEL